MKGYSVASRILRSIRDTGKAVIQEHLAIPLAVGACAVLIYIIICKIKKKNICSKSALSLFSVFFYFAMIFDVTVFSRIGQVQDPLSNVLGDWWILDTSFIMYVNFSPIINILLTLPLGALLILIIRQFFGKVYSDKKTVLLSTSVSLGLSLIIELTQLIFKLGTFQLSDLTYNTLGGLIGALLFILIKKLYKRIKKSRIDN